MSQMTFSQLPIPDGLSFCEGEFECDICGYRVSGKWCVDWTDRGNARAFMAGVGAIYAGDERIKYLDHTWAFELIAREFRARAWEAEFYVDEEIG